MPAASAVRVEPDEWLVQLSSWIIQDGNLPNLVLGQRIQRALLFHVAELQRAESGPISAQRKGASYEFVGELRRSWRIWVLNLGIYAYSDGLSWDSRGRLVAGKARLELDPYSFHDMYRGLPRMPRMTYRWELTGLWRMIDPGTPDLPIHDPDLEEIEETDAWADDGVYLLRCRLLPASRD
jgi:hypothetical protein